MYNANFREGNCHSVEAAERLEKLVDGARNRVRLSAQDPAEQVRQPPAPCSLDLVERPLDRPRADPGRRGTRPVQPESDRVGPQRALRDGCPGRGPRRRRISGTPTFCGSGPDQEIPLRMWVNWDSDRNAGRRNVDGEWVKIKNDGVTDLPIGGWLFRDSLPTPLRLPVRRRHRGREDDHALHRPPSGLGHESRDALLLGPAERSLPERRAAPGLGDGGYLFDRRAICAST